MKAKYKYDVTSDSMSKKTTPLYETKATEPPTVYFSDYAWAQLWTIVAYCKDEVGWYGLVDELDGDFLITELFVPEQEVSGVTTDIEPEAMGKLAAEIEAAGKDSSKLRYWGHSHVDMHVRPSVTDEEQIEEYLDHCDWFIRGIHNKKMESKIDVYNIKYNVIHQCCDNGRMAPVLSEEDKKDLIQSITKNVTKKIYGYQGNMQQRGTPPHHRNAVGGVNSVNRNVQTPGNGSAAGAQTPSQMAQSAIDDEWEDYRNFQ